MFWKMETFDGLVIKHFIDVIRLFNLKYEVDSNKFVKLYNKNFTIDIYIEGINANIDIIVPSQNYKRFSLGLIYRLLTGRKINYHKQTIDIEKGIEEDIIFFSKILRSDLHIILEGDKNWIKTYNEYETKESELMKKVISLPNDHPILKKFLNQDETWRDDLMKINI